MRHIEVSRLGTDLALVALYGEHDLATNGELVDELRTLVRAGHSVIVDLSQVEFIDSTVLNTLIATHRRQGSEANTLTLQCGTAPVIRRLLEITA